MDVLSMLQQWGKRRQRWLVAGTIVVMLALLLGTYTLHIWSARAVAPYFPTSGDWTTYMAGPGRSGYNVSETAINPTTAPGLKLHWQYKAGGPISAEPIVANKMLYWGAWDGFEYGMHLDGTIAWQTYLGVNSVLKGCHPHSAGVASTATVATVSIRGVNTPVVFVAGGNDIFYALNAATGSIIWHRTLGTQPAYFIWGSATFYNGSIYIGSASFGDCPLTPGQLIKLNATTGAIQNTFNVVPTGCLGGGIWSSPAIDTVTGEIYVTTGTYGNTCPVPEPYAVGMIELHSADLSVAGSWQVPVADRAPDGDFGASPTLFQAVINGTIQYMVGAGNKNGKFYAFTRGALNNGPVWTNTLGIAGNCPTCGQGIIATSAWNSYRLLVAGGTTTIKGVNCAGFLRAVDPATGTITWADCLSGGPVVGGVIAVPGLAVVAAGNTVFLVGTATGQILNSLVDASAHSHYFSTAAIAHGVLYVGNMDWSFYAYGL